VGLSASTPIADDLSVEKAGRRDAVNAYHGLTSTLLADDTFDSSDGEAPSYVVVAGDDLAAGHR
jgi:hypothetical protein